MGKLISFANGEPHIVEFTADTQLGSLRIQDQVLTSIAQGYKNASLAAPILFPTVATDQEAGRFPAFGKEALKIFTTTRGLRGKVSRMEVAYSNVTLALEEHSLGFAIDRRELLAFSGDPTQLKTIRQQMVDDALNLDREASLATAITTTSVFSTNTPISAATKAYLGSDDFVADVETGKWAIAKQTGMMPNVCLVSPAAFQVVKSSPSVIDRVKFGAAPGTGFDGKITTNLLSGVLDIPTVIVPSCIRATDAGVTSFVWDYVQSGNVVLAYVGNGYGVPSFGYSYALNGYPQVESYYENQTKSDVYEEQRIYSDAVTLEAAGYLIYGIAQ